MTKLFEGSIISGGPATSSTGSNDRAVHTINGFNASMRAPITVPPEAQTDRRDVFGRIMDAVVKGKSGKGVIV